jgi:hypothetical protein
MQWQADFAAALSQAAGPTPVFMANQSPSAKRFAVYRNTVFSSLIEALQDGFPVVEKLVGEAFFREMARNFVAAHKPKSPVLVFYGAEFGDFIDHSEVAIDLPYLGAVARLEYARRKALHAADQAYLDRQKLLRLSPADLLRQRLCLQASVAVLQSPFPQFDIWYRNAVDSSAAITAEAQNVLISRRQDTVVVLPLPVATAKLINLLQAGETIAQATTNVGAAHPEAALDHALETALHAAHSLYA